MTHTPKLLTDSFVLGRSHYQVTNRFLFVVGWPDTLASRRHHALDKLDPFPFLPPIVCKAGIVDHDTRGHTNIYWVDSHAVPSHSALTGEIEIA